MDIERKENFFIDILIPTYNRAEFLLKNLIHLEKIILHYELKNDVRIIISNNGSTDDTKLILDGFNRDITILKLNQAENLGVKKNLNLVLSASTATYCMFLGDDDYLHDEYLSKVIGFLKGDNSIHYIVPSFYPIDELGEKNFKGGRCVDIPSEHFITGKVAVRKIAHLAHQMSGLVYKREGIYEAYIKDKVDSMYPFIYYAALSCLTGKSLLLTEYPVLVTQVAQAKKDWDYGKDGLLEDKFKCYYSLFKNDKTFLTSIQMDHLNRENLRLLNYLRKGIGAYLGLFSYLLKSKFVVMPIKFYIPIYMVLNPIISIPAIIRKIMKYEKK
jgi:abequosyltransferase